MSDLQWAKTVLSQERDRITLVHQPVRTTLLFLSYSIRGVAHYIGVAFANSFVNAFLVPLVVLLCLTSFYAIPSPAFTVFSTLDANRDGFVTATEVEGYYTKVLRRSDEGVAAATQLFGDSAVSAQQFAERWRTNSAGVGLYRTAIAHGWWREAEYWLADALYWVVLGVLSSVGLGTGLHSGLLFLFPHIYRTCTAVSSCGNTNFWTFPSNPFYGPSERIFVCLAPESHPEEAARHVSLLWYLIKVVPACMLWGAGTAMGEVPPYALSYAAALQGRRNGVAQATAAAHNFMSLMENWMSEKIRRYGFWAILMLAAWPNMAFDLCGMACGQFLMPFSTFFSATLIGKAVIKVNMQALFFVALFSGDNIERAILFVGKLVGRVLPSFFPAEIGAKKVVAVVLRGRENIARQARGDTTVTVPGDAEDSESFLTQLLQWGVVLSVMWFAKSIVESFACSEQERRDEDTLLEFEMSLRRRHATPESIPAEEFRQMLVAAREEAEASQWGLGSAIFSYNRLSQIAAAVLVGWGLYNRQSAAMSLGLTLLLHRYLDQQLSAHSAARKGMRRMLRIALIAAMVCSYAYFP